MARPVPNVLHVVLRVLLATLGAYVFARAAVAAGIAVLAAGGMHYDTAWMLAMMLAFLLLLGLMLWSFTARLATVLAVLGGGTVLMMLLVRWLVPPVAG